tara:strand:- start:3297 stop:3539 length:243 start_codon:yes stop_codon:yes gene_type:complete
MKIYKASIAVEAETLEDAQGMLGQMIMEVPNQIADHLIQTMEVFEFVQKPSAIFGDRHFDLNSNETVYDEEIAEFYGEEE